MTTLHTGMAMMIHEVIPQNLIAFLERVGCKNFGVPGATMLRNGDAPYYKTRAYTDAKAYQPDVVIINLGANDSKPKNLKYNYEFVADYVAMITELQDLPTRPFIFICTPVPIPGQGSGIRDSILNMEHSVAGIFNRDTRAVINLYEPLSSYVQWFSDGIHPNAEGHKAIAEIIGDDLLRWKEKDFKKK